jgi:TRAP-type mannitol/chloroaromatic compound transport system permease small subunit
VAFFIGVVLSTWPSFLDAWRIGEYEGEGALRVPTWPVRGLVLVMSAFGAVAYLMMIVLDWQGRLIDEQVAPDAQAAPDTRGGDG